jgi:NTP pyrophosphatase (non-canonical NTP hydrolase)
LTALPPFVSLPPVVIAIQYCFHNKEPAMDRLEAALQEIRQFVRERDWQQFHDPKNLAMAIASEAGELLAEYRWVSNAEADHVTKAVEKHARVSAEAADVGIALLLFCERAGIDLYGAIEEKMILNRKHYPVEQSQGHSERPKLPHDHS